ncbi:MAG: SDR family oxidoreductase [marine benthic group bacterium]|nr:SDR family oxidoreductase [Gemmatimonadota bacterium]
MSRIFLTGFPGFLGAELLPRVLGRSEGTSALCLVQSRFADLARRRLVELELAEPRLRGRVAFVEGDITRADLGLGASRRRHASDVTEIHHLAAIYDLGVRREVGMRVNLYGTRHVLDFGESCPKLRRFHYVSTCYVSGRYAGIFGEDVLERGQSFNNYYEETKFLAEVEVRARMQGGMPATIYRPSIVVGDSRTGETQKYDGPYALIRWMLRQRSRAVVPVFDGADESRINLVPRDFVIDSIGHLSSLPHSAGRTYQLADPDPPTVGEALERIAVATDRQLIRVRVPKSVARRLVARIPGLARLTGIQPEAFDYFDHPTHYSVQHATTDLQGSGIWAPPFRDYVDRLVAFVRAHPEVDSGPMA